MRIAINLDNKLPAWAEKVGNGKTDDRLPAEFAAVQLGVGQASPQSLFRFGWVFPHFLGASMEFGELLV